MFGLVIIAGWLLVLTVRFNVVLAGRLHQQTAEALTARAESVAATITFAADGTLSVGESTTDSVLDSGVWVYQGRRAAERSPGLTSLQYTADLLADRGAQFLDGPDAHRLYALPIVRGNRQVATVVVATSLSAAQNASRTALWGSAALAVLLLAGAYAVLRVATGRALRPVDVMTAQAADWSAHNLGQRFGRYQHFRELQTLAHHLDAVLDHLSAVVRHERQLPAELSHELRTPLSRILAETELLMSRPRSAEAARAAHLSIRDAAHSMQKILETLLATARADTAEAPGRCAVLPTLEHLVAAHRREGRTVNVTVARADLAVGVEAAVLERILSPIIENAFRHTDRLVDIRGDDVDGAVAVLVINDGPGVSPHLIENIFTPGFRADSGDGHLGAGLGLALARRLARASDGDVTVLAQTSLCTFRIDLPAG